jgi:hypothetical protein
MSAKHAPVGRPLFFLLLIVVWSAIGSGVRQLRAQSLADVAQKEEARRKATPEATKIYTNKDLNAAPAGPVLPADAKAGEPAKDAGAKDAKASDDAAAKDKQSVRDKTYWFGRLTKLQQQVDKDESAALAIQTRDDSLSADVVKADDPDQRLTINRERQKSVAELNRLTKSIADGKKSIADLEEEARRAGVPPGWLR